MEDNKDTNVEKVEETTQKTYTAEDCDNSFKAGFKKAHDDLKKDKDYQEFLGWKKTNQNDSERLKELETSNLDKDNKIRDLEASLELKDSDVKPEFVKFVKSEVLSLVSDTKDFGTALKEFKKSSPQYFGETKITKVQSSPTLQGGTKPQTSNDIMNNYIRGK